MSSPPSGPLIEVRDIVKRYGPTTALDGVSLQVDDGEVVGLLGANGAGKTTLIESIVGARTPDAGQLTVAGYDPQRQRAQAAARVAVQPQGSALFKYLTVREHLELYAAQYPSALPVAEILSAVGLQSKAARATRTLSGGQMQRLRLALALVANTPVLLLDEPTVGLDPTVRQAIWDIVRHRSGQGALLLATQMMDEAEALCSRVVVLDAGRVVADGTVSELLAAHAYEGGVAFTADADVSQDRLLALPGVTWASARSFGQSTSVRLVTSDQEATARAVRATVSFRASQYRQTAPSLTDVFFTLVGAPDESTLEEEA